MKCTDGTRQGDVHRSDTPVTTVPLLQWFPRMTFSTPQSFPNRQVQSTPTITGAFTLHLRVVVGARSLVGSNVDVQCRSAYLSTKEQVRHVQRA